MTTAARKTFICPNCAREVETNILTSANTFGGTTTDFHKLASGFEPLRFLIHSCQNCGFTGSASAFKGVIAPDVAARIKELIYPHVRDEHLKVDIKWEFADLIAEWQKQKPDVVAQLYLNAAWCTYEIDKERYYRRRAVDWFEQAIDAGVKNRLIILYLIGELYRRLGETEVASHWFDVAIAEAEQQPDASRIKELAIQQKTNPQEML